MAGTFRQMRRVSRLPRRRALAATMALGVVLVATAVAYAGAAGHLDPSFGNNGRVALHEMRGYASSTAIGPNGRIIASWSYGSDFSVARLRHDGALDRSFGNDGIATIPSGSPQAATTSVAIGHKGVVVVVGMACTEDEDVCDLVVSRLRRNGELNRRFGDDGSVRMDFGNQRETRPSVALATHGRVIVEASDCPAGGESGGCNIGLARLRRHGGLDRRFGDRGKVLLRFWRQRSACAPRLASTGDFMNAGAMALDSRERIVVVVTCSGRNGPTLARFKPNGNLDRSFGRAGKVYTDVGTKAADALAIDARDRIDVAGAGDDGFVVARFRRNGELDSSFGRRGGATARFPGSNGSGVPYSIALDSKRRIVAGGVLGTSRFETAGAFARFKRDGPVNRHFGRRGTVILDRGFNVATSIAIDSRDRIVGIGRLVVRLLG
jgi:uncharacterized delta-60 repeat protein